MNKIALCTILAVVGLMVYFILLDSSYSKMKLPVKTNDRHQTAEGNLLSALYDKFGRMADQEANDTRTLNKKEKHGFQMLPALPRYPIDCVKVFKGIPKAIEQAEKITSYVHIKDVKFQAMTKDCAYFKKSRGYITEPVNTEEEEFPLAFSFQIYKDIVQVERLLRAIYRPQNVYCVNVDKSSPAHVHKGWKAIASCFDNIITTDVDVEWATFSQVETDLLCMKHLYNMSTDWKYFLTVAGQEFPLKTNLEIVRILHALNGSNAVKAITKRRNLERWNFLPPPPVNVTLVKGSCHFAVTRAFVRYVLEDKRALLFKDWTSKTLFPDEHYFQSLSHSPQLGVPGAYTGIPEIGVDGYTQLMPYVIWPETKTPCLSKSVRTVCVFGLKNLQFMTNSICLFVNKLYYNYQPMALQCLEERHWDWVRDDILGKGADRINLTFYSNLPNVKHHIPSGLEH